MLIIDVVTVELILIMIVGDLLYPLVGTLFYLSLPKTLRCHPHLLFTVSLLHNGTLTLFSFYTFQGVFVNMYNQGLVFQHRYYFHDSEFDRFIFLFYLSKYYEYVDTLLLYLQGKTPIFLQKFHHIGAVICWHLAYYYKVDSVGFITIANSFIHTIMYSYYFISLFRLPWIRKYKVYVTSLQLLQLSSAVVLPILYYPPNETPFNYRILMVFNAYVFCLILLFLQFSYRNYL